MHTTPTQPPRTRGASAVTSLNQWVAAGIAAYFIAGLLTNATGEIFPIWSWFLFSHVPQPRQEYSVLILEARGQPLQPPVLYETAVNVVPSPHGGTPIALIRTLGTALDNGERARAEELRGTLEVNDMPDVTRYDVVRGLSDPLERWKTGKFQFEHIATFVRGKGSP